MIYRDYGQTGKKVSLLGFGGMRFENVDDHDKCVQMMLAAAEGGVNYFDTAPGYFETKSETVFGKGFAEMRKRGLPYFSATKTFESTESNIRREIEGQLKRLGIDSIDFYHIWCITSLENWEGRKKDGILQTFRKLKEEGLVKHICISSHLMKDEIKQLLLDAVFEGVLFGYSAVDFQARQAAFDAVIEKKLGAVVMNPLGGGVIPGNPQRFGFLQRPGENITAAALRFLWDHPEISVTLVGFQTLDHVKDALAAIEGYKPRSKEELESVKAAAGAALSGICTGCAYCDNCPEGIPIVRFMDTYNQKLLFDKADGKKLMGIRMKYHWGGLRAELAGKCTACGLCNKACTQKIDIVERLKEIAQLKPA
ncbi:MAG: aldo/keto reductase [Spirochaetes bacterium]|nr:aldo/keto reductase [Spirochaetota bacterium]